MTSRRGRAALAGAIAVVLVVQSPAGGRARQASERQKSYSALIETYRNEPAIAAATITTWTDDEVQEASETFAKAWIRSVPLPDVRVTFTAAMLHTDAAMQWAQADSKVSAILHMRIAASILDEMTRRTQLTRDFPFAPALWHLAVVRALTALFDWDVEYSVLRTGRSDGQAQQHVRELSEAAERERAGAGAQMYLALGSLADGSAHMVGQLRQLSESPPRRFRLRVTETDLDNWMKQADRFYRRALERDPALVEARLRLGRLLLMRGRRAEAGDELRRTQAAAKEPRQTYLACLFLGRLAEATGDTGEALKWYGQAVAAWPGSQTARIALASMQEKLGNIEAVHASIVALLDRDAGSLDPWGKFFVGDADEGLRALDEMRERVRTTRIP